MKIPGFNDYEYIDEKIINKKKKEITISKTGNGIYCKMKNDEGKWKAIAYSKIKALVGEKLIMTIDAQPIPGTNDTYFVNKQGIIYSFSNSYPNGKILKPNIGKSGYPGVTIRGKRREVHTLVVKTFIMEDYVERGLCCLHSDDDKSNFKLSNLSVGTYSKKQ